MKVNLLNSNENKYSSDCISEFYRCILEDAKTEATLKQVRLLRFKKFLIRLLNKLCKYIKFNLLIIDRKKVNFSAQLSPNLKLCIPSHFLSSNNFIYMFDAWPSFHALLSPMLDLLNTKAIFFSSKEVNQYFIANTNAKCKSYWIPEGIYIEEYKYLEFKEKKIDVLEFGRCYEKYHNLIVDTLKTNNKNHLHLKQNERILFETRQEFIAGLSQSKISICVPSNITHPERAENISTMTLRYLQSMASKCLIVGILPEEMKDLFDYNPIIEIDFCNPQVQILSILDNYESYYPLIQKNYDEVFLKHQWKHRWEKIDNIIQNSIL